MKSKILTRFAIIFLYLAVSCTSSGKDEINIETSIQGPFLLKNLSSGLFDANGKDIKDLFNIRTTNDTKVLAFPKQPLDTSVVEVITFSNSENKQQVNHQLREACVLYIQNYSWGSGINKICPHEEGILITPQNVGVEEYSVTYAGVYIFYTVKNFEGGKDIWKIDRDGNNNQKFVDCKNVVCSNPIASPDDSTLAYISVDKSDQPSIMLQNGNQVEQISQVNPAQIPQLAWSWTGRYLSYASKNEEIIIYDVFPLKQILFRFPVKSIGSWVKYSDDFIFTYPIYWGGIPNMQVETIHVATNEVSKITGGGAEAIEFGIPSGFSPTNDVIVPYRSQTGGFSLQLCIVKNTRSCLPISNEQQYSYTPFGFDPSGRYFLYQRLEIGKSDAFPQIGIWDILNSSHIILSQNGRFPQWLP